VGGIGKKLLEKRSSPKRYERRRTRDVPDFTRLLETMGHSALRAERRRGVGRKRGRAKGRQSDVHASGPQRPQQLETRLQKKRIEKKMEGTAGNDGSDFKDLRHEGSKCG